MSFVGGFRHILKTEGLSGVYQGAAATAMKQGSNQGLRFMWFNEYKRITKVDTSKEDRIKQTDVKAILKQSAKEIRVIQFITDNIIETGRKKLLSLRITT